MPILLPDVGPFYMPISTVKTEGQRSRGEARRWSVSR
jgi:hypothetical protein